MEYSDDTSSNNRDRRERARETYESDDYERRERKPKRIYESRRVAPRTRGDRVKTQLDELGEIERAFYYDTEDSEDVGKYKNIRIVNYPPGYNRNNRRPKYSESEEVEDESLDKEGIPLKTLSRQSQNMLPHKPPPKKIEAFETKLDELNRYIHPYGFFWTFWSFLVILLCIYELIMVPFVVAYKFLGNGGLYAFDYIVDFFFAVDIVLLFFVARAPKTYYLITDRTRVSLFYAWGWFIVDFVASFPMDIWVWIAFGLAPRNYTRFLKVFHLFRLYRGINQLTEKAKEKENLTSEKWILLNPNIERFAALIIFFYLVIHYAGCLWITYGNTVGFGSSAFQPPLSLSGAAFGPQYLESLFWGFYSIVGPFSLIHRPTSIGETFFSLLLGIFGLIFLVGFVSLLTNLLRTVDDQRSQWQKNQMDINLSNKKKEAKEWLLIQLASEPLFEGIGFEVLQALASRCKFKSFPPHVTIVKEEALPGPYLYFLRRGVLQESKEGQHRAFLGSGSSFNQRGFLVPKTKADYTLHTVKYSELFVLRKSDLIRVSQFYPAFHDHLVSKMKE